jgi:predicted aspartyl protease
MIKKRQAHHHYDIENMSESVKQMVIGGMGQDGRPMVPVVVQGADGLEKKFTCLLWTGFAEGLLLPTEEVTTLNLVSIGKRMVQFADGSRIEAAAYPTQVLLGGEAHELEVLAWDGEPRLGMALFADCRLSMQFIKGGTISIERI